MWVVIEFYTSGEITRAHGPFYRLKAARDFAFAHPRWAEIVEVKSPN